jgi:RNA polymerase sigma-70 factor (ECF subfamily)
MLRVLPSVRTFAWSLCGSADHVDDIVQETVANALANIHTFQPGTNLAAWLVTIARNAFFNGCRKRARDLAYKNELTWTAPRSIRPEQDSRVEHSELAAMLLRLPAEQREALLLVGGSGLSQEDAAKTCGVAVGTIKSRVHRARLRLSNMMHLDNDELNVAINEPFAAVA